MSVLVCVAAACAAPRAAPPATIPGESHETAQKSKPPAPALEPAGEPDVPSATKHLAEALAAGDANAAIVSANWVLVLGGSVDEPTRARIAVLVDDVPGGAL